MMFVSLKRLDLRAQLALKLAVDASFLSKQQIEEIVSCFSNDLLQEQINIKVVTEAKKFSTYACNMETGIEHSWAGSDIEFQTSTPLLGDVIIGKNVNIEYSNNGSYGGKEEEYIDPEFDTTEIQAVFVFYGESCTFNNRYRDDKQYLIVIYNPLEGYKVSPEIQYILDNFKL